MGQAQIKEVLSDSEYKIQYLHDSELAAAKKSFLDERKLALNKEKISNQTQIDNQLIVLDDAIAALDAAIDTPFNPDDAGEVEAHDKSIKLAAENSGKQRKILKGLVDNQTQIVLQIADLEKQLELLALAIADIPVFTVWCADYYVSLAVDAIVPTLEINDEYNLSNQHVLIMPHTFRAKQQDIDLWIEQSDNQQFKIDDFNSQIDSVNLRLIELTTEQADKEAEIVNAFMALSSLANQAPRDDAAYTFQQSAIETLEFELSIIINEISAKIEKGLILEKQRVLVEARQAIIDAEKATFDTSLANNTPIVPLITAETGLYQPFIASDDFTSLFNKLILNGVQKWNPVFRVGKITALDFEVKTASVLLEFSEKDISAIAIDGDNEYLNINQGVLLNDVNIQYSFSHAHTFKINDVVVVDFNKDFNYPNIIGFESNPVKPPFFLVEDKDEYLTIFYWDDPSYYVEAWQIKLSLLDENKTLFDVYANYADYNVVLNGATVQFSGGNERRAQYFSTQWLTEARLFYPPEITESNKPVLKISQRVRPTVPQTKPDTSHFITVQIIHKTSLEKVLSVSIELNSDESFVAITDNDSQRLAPKTGFVGEYFTLNY